MNSAHLRRLHKDMDTQPSEPCARKRQAELEQQKAEFFAKGGTIEKIPPSAYSDAVFYNHIRPDLGLPRQHKNPEPIPGKKKRQRNRKSLEAISSRRRHNMERCRQLILDGKTRKEVAEILKLSSSCIDTYMAELLRENRFKRD